MKAQADSTKNSGLASGVRERKSRPNKQLESVEMMEYFSKLQELIPCMPKNKKLSKLEVISNTIEYIHDLRQTLGFPPCEVDCDMDSEGAFSLLGNPAENQSNKINSSISSPVTSPASTPLQSSKPPHQHRQPLGVISNPKYSD